MVVETGFISCKAYSFALPTISLLIRWCDFIFIPIQSDDDLMDHRRDNSDGLQMKRLPYFTRCCIFWGTPTILKGGHVLSKSEPIRLVLNIGGETNQIDDKEFNIMGYGRSECSKNKLSMRHCLDMHLSPNPRDTRSGVPRKWSISHLVYPSTETEIA
jgi:hypothetical protein